MEHDAQGVSFNYDMISKLSDLEELRSSWKEVRGIASFSFVIGLQNSEYCQHPSLVRYEKYAKFCNGIGSNTPILDVLAETEGFELVDHKEIKQLSDFGTTNMNRIQGFLIESCVAIETIMDTVGSELLPNLEELILKNLPKLKSIWKEGPLQPGCQASKLTTLVISNCRVLVNVFPPGAIQQLCGIQYLTIEKCDEVEEIFPQADANANLPVLPNLKELILLDMTKLSCICAIELRKRGGEYCSGESKRTKKYFMELCSFSSLYSTTVSPLLLRFSLNLHLPDLLLGVLSFLTADTIAKIGAVTGVVGTTAGIMQAVSEAKQAFWDTLKVTPSDNVEETCDALNETAQVLGSVRKDFENESRKIR
ncbi:hypothetical protein Vadar_011712 [Vaccinium darrowii]|uniref:Uncharacterized protein n=1 Tax=Vaccinium darrowii TaxID=229202 RepID=A0ACB7X000_9ERIC|nr:hypothetical protein Vadar_011712 [Vaccinium darrowii]